MRTRHISAPVPRGPLSRWLYMRAAAHVVTTGEALKRELVERNGFSASRIDSVATGIDAGRFRPGERKASRARFGLPQDRTLVGIVATLRSWKGHRYLIDAVAALADPYLRLVIVGDGPQFDALRAQVRDAGLGERVALVGQQADVAPWMRAFDVFALPSYANEGVPQALMQAMLAGVPVVTTPVGSILEVVEDGRTGLVVPPRDASALATAIARLLDAPELARRLRSAAPSPTSSTAGRSGRS